MTFIQSELDKIARNCDHFRFPKCVGRNCIGRLNEDVAIKISFKAMQSSGIYNALQIRLINRVGGDIDTQLISFTDLWGKVRMNGNGDIIRPHIWEDNGNPHWYGFTPTESQYIRLYQAVESYLECFAEPDQTESEEMDYSM